MTTSTVHPLTQPRAGAPPRGDRSRAIGPAGTVARIVGGGWIVGSVTAAEISGGFTPLVWILGLVVIPGVLLCAQWTRLRHTQRRLHATGPGGHAATIGLFLVLYLTQQYAPGLEATSDAALIFFGASMLLAAARGYAGCEVLAISNWLLRRDDQVGCVVYGPVDFAEARLLRVS